MYIKQLTNDYVFQNQLEVLLDEDVVELVEVEVMEVVEVTEVDEPVLDVLVTDEPDEEFSVEELVEEVDGLLELFDVGLVGIDVTVVVVL